jgi:small subunit ribosomal protein S18
MPKFQTIKECFFCKKHIRVVDYKDVSLLTRYTTHWGRIESGRRSGACHKHQRSIGTAIKRARHLALLPFTTK